jgi:acyl-CoA thioester hydrolase
MVTPAPASGVFDGPLHRFAVRVYFEDTDLSGVVYHANYLRYMERARSDMLGCIGIDQRAAFEGSIAGDEGVYAVTDLAIKYRRPARLDDALTVVSHVQAMGAATATIHQAVMRGSEILTEATVTAAFLTREGRPRRQPKPWVEAFQKLVSH